MTTRPATAADVAAVHAIATANPTAPQWNIEQFHDILAPRPGSAIERRVIVAQDRHTVAGFAIVSALTAIYPVEAELESIAVAPQQQGQGIGRALLQAAFSWCREKGVVTLRLEVRASNKIAISLYERHGFQQEGTRPGYYASPAEDAICMVWSNFPVETLPSPQ